LQKAALTMDVRPDLAVEASGLVKVFDGARAVDGLDLAVPTGSVVGLLGPNGAGKTTTIRMLATLLRPDAGTARVLGHDVARDADAVRRRVSLTGQFSSVDQDLTGQENLVLVARLQGFTRTRAKARSRELLNAFGLADVAGRRVATYSGGMRRRLDLATSIVAHADVLFLDEPTTGLDPHSRNQVWRVVRELVAGGTTVLLTTQYLDEADNLSDRIIVIDHGTVIAEGIGAELKASVGSATLRIRLPDADRLPQAELVLREALGEHPHVGSNRMELSAPVADPRAAVKAIAELSRAGVPVSDFALARPSLDEVFLALTGHPVDAQPGNLTNRNEDAA
jgi:ABC-2 type transport system ATP-binding protein